MHALILQSHHEGVQSQIIMGTEVKLLQAIQNLIFKNSKEDRSINKLPVLPFVVGEFIVRVIWDIGHFMYGNIDVLNSDSLNQQFEPINKCDGEFYDPRPDGIVECKTYNCKIHDAEFHTD